MKSISIRVAQSTLSLITKFKEITGLQTYNDVILFVLSKYEEDLVKTFKKDKS
jgi:hypothetical protein